MPADASKLVCPRCGVEMNHNADKVLTAVSPEDTDPALGGVLEEFHTCPQCGAGACRAAS